MMFMHCSCRERERAERRSGTGVTVPPIPPRGGLRWVNGGDLRG